LQTIIKGTIGELSIKKRLLEDGYNIFTPEVDNGTDLIVECTNGILKRVQVKSISQLKTNTSVEIKTEKYMENSLIDVIAVYLGKDIEHFGNMIAFVPYTKQHTIVLALTTGKNNQEKKRNWFYQYNRFPEFS
tara:strand:- start:464 stop:862 length:399 start_codon:yes stop_codon:yes gene_type:complete